MQFKLEEITQWLEESAADFMLSRSEKRVFKNTLHGRFFTAREIAFINSEVKRIALEKLTDHNAEDLIHWMYDCQKVLLNYEREDKDVELAEAFFSPGRDCLGEIITCIRKAIRSIDVCVFTISDDRIAEALVDAKTRGVAVRIISDNDKQYDKGSDIEFLKESGIPVWVDRTDAHMHHKFAIFDNHTLVTGSFNWTRSASSSNYENIIALHDPQLLASFGREFDELLERDVERL